jgi:hypothetical protein
MIDWRNFLRETLQMPPIPERKEKKGGAVMHIIIIKEIAHKFVTIGTFVSYFFIFLCQLGKAGNQPIHRRTQPTV